MKKQKSVKVDGEEKLEVKRILNKWKIREVIKYLVHWKRFIVEYDIWEKEKDLGNIKEVVANFKERISIKVRR